MTAQYELLIALIRSQMNGTAYTLPPNSDLQALADIARKHKLEPFLYMALENDSLPQPLADRLFGTYHRAHFRDVQYDYVQQEITQALTQKGIDHVFMRGICLKHAYPDPALRTMSDIDILVRSHDLPKLRKALKHTNGVQEAGDGNHRNYRFPPDVKAEFHPMLLHCSSPVATEINPGWQLVPDNQPTFRKEMSPEGFYLNVMCHFANHFFAGGAGIRFVLDIWVCNHRMPPLTDRAFVEAELKRVGIADFAKKAEQLSEIWFSGSPMDPELQEMAEYIFASGLHGRDDYAMLNAICFSPGGSGFSALLRRIFYPKGDLENRYDWVQGRPWLKWAAWLARAFRVVTRRFGMLFRWSKGTGSFTKEQIRKQKEKLERFGASFKENG